MYHCSASLLRYTLPFSGTWSSFFRHVMTLTTDTYAVQLYIRIPLFSVLFRYTFLCDDMKEPQTVSHGRDCLSYGIPDPSVGVFLFYCLRSVCPINGEMALRDGDLRMGREFIPRVVVLCLASFRLLIGISDLFRSSLVSFGYSERSMLTMEFPELFPPLMDVRQLEQVGFSSEQIAGLAHVKTRYQQGAYHEVDPEDKRKAFIRWLYLQGRLQS